MSENNDTYKVICLIINILDAPTPPPPPVDASNQETADFRDSIINHYTERNFINEDIVVAIEPKFRTGYKQISLENKYKKNYQILLDSLLSIELETHLDISKIKSKSTISLIEAPQNTELSNLERWKDFDFLVSISKVIFNKKNTRAVVVVGIGSGRLSGATSLFLFEKMDNKWKIIDRQLLTIS